MNRDGVVADFCYDDTAGYGNKSFIPSRESLQKHVRKYWNHGDLHFCGIVHSHPICNKCLPSEIDIKMAQKILKVNRMKSCYLLMVRDVEIRPYLVFEDGICLEESLEVMLI